ncbi:MAG: AAA family ATPase, partial [Bacteroidota bacterium]|nr:AAA family ATPase [Bacteroidota bacterium]
GYDTTYYSIKTKRLKHELALIKQGIYQRMLVSEKSNQVSLRGNILSVISNKGGVGKTTVSIELAHQFARMGLKTLLFDLDLGNADVSNKLKIFPEHTLYNFFNKEKELKDLVVKTDFGFHFISGECGEFKLANMTWSQKQRFFRYIQKIAFDYDLLPFDLGAGITRHVVDFSLVADDSFIVTTPNDIISGYAAAKAAFMRFIEINSKMAKNTAKTVEEYTYASWFILNQVNNQRHGSNLYKSLKKTINEHVNQNSVFKITSEFLGSVVADRDRLLDTYAKREIIGLKHPRSELAQNYRQLAQQYLGLNPDVDEPKPQRGSGLMRFVRMLGGKNKLKKHTIEGSQL